jgi:hypothetical protein
MQLHCACTKKKGRGNREWGGEKIKNRKEVWAGVLGGRAFWSYGNLLFFPKYYEHVWYLRLDTLMK